MSKLLSGVAVTLSAIASILSGWTVYRLSQLQTILQQQQETIAQQQTTITEFSQQIEKDRQQLSQKNPPQTHSVNVVNREKIAAIQPGQFIRQGFENKIKIELLSVKRISNPDSEERNIVVVQMRLRRTAPSEKVEALSLSQSKGRNPETSEVYRTITNKSTTLLYINKLPENSWGNAYFWLKVPETVSKIDLVIPQTAIFANVPISS